MSTAQRDGFAVLSVRDQGIGISEEQLASIFERYERGVSPQSFGGLGLGLYVVRRIAEAHGGGVHVESRAGEGANFIVDAGLTQN